MQDQARKITYGAMMVALFALLLAVTLYVPLIGFFTLFFIPLPILLYRLKYDRMSTIAVMAATFFVTAIIGGLLSVPAAIILSLVGVVIGETIQAGQSKLYVFMATGVTLLITSMMAYVGSIYVFNINPIDQLLNEFELMQEQMMTFLSSSGNTTREVEELISSTFVYYQSIIPALFILTSFLLAYFFVLPNLAIASRIGFQVPKFASFRNMRLPMITVFVYGILLLFSLFNRTDPGTTSYLVEANAMIILRFLFFLQGLSLIYYALHSMKLPIIVNVLATIFAALFSPITVLLGILDTGVNVRAWIGKDRMR